MLEFVHHSTIAVTSLGIINDNQWATFKANEKVLKVIVSYIKSPNSTAHKIDLFLLQAASILLNERW